MKVLKKVLVALFFSVFGCGSPSTWLTDRGSLAHVASVNANISLPLQIKWKKQLANPIIGSAVGSNNRDIVVGIGNDLVALNSIDGSISWKYSTDGQISNSPTSIILEKGSVNRVAIVDGVGNLHLLNGSDGSLVWKIEDGIGSFNSATNFATNYLFYSKMISADSSVLRSVNIDNGDIEWEKHLNRTLTATPMHGFGRIFNGINTSSSIEYRGYQAITGQLTWNFNNQMIPSPNQFFNNGLIDTNVELNNDAKIYLGVGNDPTHVKAISIRTGNEIWSTNLGRPNDVVGLSLTQERTINYLIVVQDDLIYCINPTNGNIIWANAIERNSSFEDNRRTPQPIIWGDYSFHISGNRTLKAYELSTGNEVWDFDLNGTVFASPIVNGNTLYIGTVEGTFYAFSQ